MATYPAAVREWLFSQVPSMLILNTSTQPATSKLLSLPAELRLSIYGYMSLSPTSEDCLQWTGAFYACRQLHDEMKDALQPEEYMKDVAKLTCSKRIEPHCAAIVDLKTEPLMSLHVLTVKLPALRWNSALGRTMSCCEAILKELYKLHLRHLTIIWTHNPEQNDEVKDLKSFTHPLDCAKLGKVNCRSLTFRVEALAKAEGGRTQVWTLENFLYRSPNRLPYLLEIVQDADERQSERTLTSASRWKEEGRGAEATGA